MNVEVGEYFEQNQRRLDAMPGPEAAWAAALEKCKTYILLRLKKRTDFGAHSATRLGEEALHYYTSFAYDAILSGKWEWKEQFSLSEQMCRIAGSAISNEVDKTKTQKAGDALIVLACDDLETLFYEEDPPPEVIGDMDQLIIDQKIIAIEETINGDHDCELFWDCIKEGLKRADIAALMEKTPKQVDKLREQFIKKIKTSPYFESV